MSMPPPPVVHRYADFRRLVHSVGIDDSDARLCAVVVDSLSHLSDPMWQCLRDNHNSDRATNPEAPRTDGEGVVQELGELKKLLVEYRRFSRETTQEQIEMTIDAIKAHCESAFHKGSQFYKDWIVLWNRYATEHGLGADEHYEDRPHSLGRARTNTPSSSRFQAVSRRGAAF